MQPSNTTSCGMKDGSKPLAAAADVALLAECDGCSECGELLHGLNNALASVLLNAQVMAWKLPSYSRSKRYLHEIERNAQRGGELVRRLLERSHDRRPPDLGECPAGGQVAVTAGFDSVTRGPERGTASAPAEPRPEP